MREVSYLTGASWRGGALDPNGLPGAETPNFVALSEAARAQDIAFTVRRWDDDALLAHPPEAALIRSCWD